MSRSLSKTDIAPDVGQANSKPASPVFRRTRTKETARAPGSDAINVILRSFINRHDVFASQFAKTKKRATEKAIHDLRVSIRRFVAVLDVIRIIVPATGLSKTRKQLKRLLNAFSELRDVQVQIVTVRGLVGEFNVLNLFLTLLLVREKQIIRRMHVELRDFRIEQINPVIAGIEKELQSVLADPVLRDAAKAIVLGTLARTFSRVVQLKPAALTGKGNRIHRLRIAFKRFRYTVEALGAILPNVTTRLMKSMNAYQVRMGNIQDIDIMIASIRDHAKSHRRFDQAQFRMLIDRLMERRRELVLEFLSSVDELGFFWKKLGRVIG